MVSQVFTGDFYLCTYIASLFLINMEGMVLFLYGCPEFLFLSIQNAPLLIGILVLCAVFSHTCLTVGKLLSINSVTDRTHYIMSVSGQCTFVLQWSFWEHVVLQT